MWMGDRGNIVVDGVWLYTHWTGSKIKGILKSALVRGRDRWDDGQYLARIIFCEMLKGAYDNPAEALDDLTSFGIGTKMGDNEHNILFVDTSNQTLTEKTEKGTTMMRLTFEQFVGDLKSE
jgi:hypothetical protein